MLRVVFFLFLLTLPAWAALPPQSQEDLTESSEVIVRAEVVSVKKKMKMRKNGYDHQYTLKLLVKDWLKGEPNGDELTALCEQTAARPNGWAGPQGQNDVPSPGERGTFYLRRGSDGALYLLEPNGWEPESE